MFVISGIYSASLPDMLEPRKALFLLTRPPDADIADDSNKPGPMVPLGIAKLQNITALPAAPAITKLSDHPAGNAFASDVGGVTGSCA